MNVRSLLSSKRFPIWQAVLFYAAVSVVGFLTSRANQKPVNLYEEELKQAPWAPPGWVFGPAWSFINIWLTRALFTLIHEPDKGAHDKAMLALQGAIWAIFCTFGIVYFRKKSPVLAAAWTVADAGLATASILLARKRGVKFAAQYLPLLVWTYFASTIAVYQALENRDPALETEALFV
jgi:tryptophan-rich sensory protein